MRVLITIFLLLSIVSCQPYKETTTITTINIDEAGMRKYNTLNELPRRIRRSELFRYHCFTRDTNEFANPDLKTRFLSELAYDNKQTAGYILYRYKTGNANEFVNTCIIFQVRGGSLNSNFFSVSANVNSWKEAHAFLTSSNMKLFGGRIATEREARNGTERSGEGKYGRQGTFSSIILNL